MKKKLSKKYLIDIIRPPKKRLTEIPQPILESAPKKTPTKKTFGVGLTIFLITILIALFFYSLSFINISNVFKNAARSLLSSGLPQNNENIFKKINDEFRTQLKEIPQSIDAIASIGGAIFQSLNDFEYLKNYGLSLALNKKGNLILEKLENLKNNLEEISATIGKFNNQSFKDINFSGIENFIPVLINWLKTEPEQHLQIIFPDEDGAISFYADITIKNASIENIITKNTEDKAAKFGGKITVNLSVIKEIAKITELNFEEKNLPDFFPQILEKIADSEERLKSVIYSKISNAFQNKEIEVYFPNEAIQSFFNTLTHTD